MPGTVIVSSFRDWLDSSLLCPLDSLMLWHFELRGFFLYNKKSGRENPQLRLRVMARRKFLFQSFARHALRESE
jgi:hypothetical protein